MDYVLSTKPLAELQASLLAIPAFEDGFGALFEAADAMTSGLLGTLVEEEQFKAKSGSSLLVHTPNESAKRILVVGLGKHDAFDASVTRSFGAAAIADANARKLSDLTLVLPSQADAIQGTADAVCGVELGAYQFTTFRTEGVEEPTCATVTVVGADGPAAEAAMERAQHIAAGVCLARDLVNGPPVQVTPTYLAETAKTLAEEGGLSCTIFGRDELIERGMNLIIAVGQGSDEEQKLIHLVYTPEDADTSTPSIALVGKGVTYDAGGYNLKPTGAIEDMKIDMGGAAAVLGTMKAVIKTKPSVIIHALVPSVENLISGAAYKAGDVFTSYSGKTVEIMNTDAEGRLILADALAYATEQKVDKIIDLATLTGACMVALGPHTAGLFCDDDEFASKIANSAKAAGESVWRMPLEKKLRPMLKSPIADIKNIGQRWGGAITAGLFLQTFTGDVTWAHLDIAGPASADKADGYIKKGGTGFGVATLTALLDGEI